jgi:hypothetical protein
MSGMVPATDIPVPMSGISILTSSLPPGPDVPGATGGRGLLTRLGHSGDEDCGHQAYQNTVVYAPSDLLAWCRLDELNTNSCRAILDKSQRLGSAP